MMKLNVAQSVKQAFAKFAPPSLTGSWDNTGLLVEAPTPCEGRTILLTIDLTPYVLQEALAMPTQPSVIVAYHPIIFRPLKSLTMDDPQQKTILQCIASGISVYSPHTALDVIEGGINDWLARSVVPEGSIESSAAIQSSSGNPHVGEGRKVQVKSEVKLALQDIVQHIRDSKHFHGAAVANAVPFCPSAPAYIQSFAVCAGSGTDVLGPCAGKVDLVVTGEMSHHAILAHVTRGTHVICLRHTSSERGYLSDVLRDQLTLALRACAPEVDFDVITSQADRDPLDYFSC